MSDERHHSEAGERAEPETDDRERSEPEAAEPEPTDREPPDEEALERRRIALAQVVKFGDPVLRSRASEVSRFDDGLRQEVARMIDLMQEGMGVGLAATQLGSLRRVFVFQASPEAEPRAVVNPRIAWVSEETEVAEEGCLSLPGISLDVERPQQARLEGLDESGEEVSFEASGLEARVLQHELDHLDGVLILDRAPREQRRAALKALRRGEEYHPPEDPEGLEAEAV